jgi:hypothetical protein
LTNHRYQFSERSAQFEDEEDDGYRPYDDLQQFSHDELLYRYDGVASTFPIQ